MGVPEKKFGVADSDDLTLCILSLILSPTKRLCISLLYHRHSSHTPHPSYSTGHRGPIVQCPPCLPSHLSSLPHYLTPSTKIEPSNTDCLLRKSTSQTSLRRSAALYHTYQYVKSAYLRHKLLSASYNYFYWLHHNIYFWEYSLSLQFHWQIYQVILVDQMLTFRLYWYG